MAQPPDLRSVLASLAQYSQPRSLPDSRSDTDNHGRYIRIGPVLPTQDSNNYTPASAADQGVAAKSLDPRALPQSRATTPLPAKSVIDPATITTWQEGLRCVTKISAQNKTFDESIRRMMRDQRAQEMRWYSERQAIKRNQANRSASSAQALSILQSLNGTGTGGIHQPQSEHDKQAELAVFDQKVYTAQHTMNTAMTSELKGLGVPFFGTSEALIVKAGEDVMSIELPDGQPKYSQLVTDDELRSLRRRMVSHLEDLYRD